MASYENDSPVLSALLTRHSLKPKYLCEPAPTTEQLQTCVRAALRAPDHCLLVPYRFFYVVNEDRSTVAEIFAQASRRRGDSEDKVERSRSKAGKGPGLIGFIVVDGPEGDVPREEKLLTAGAALENFMLALNAQGFGGLIVSGSFLNDKALQDAFCQKPTEKLLAWILVGTPAENAPVPAAEDRTPPLTQWKRSQSDS